MKAVAVTMLVIFFLVLTVVTESVATRGINEGEPLLDYTGNPVKPRTPYLIQVANDPAKWVSRDKRVSTSNCPKAAVLSSSANAIPVKFFQKSAEDHILLDRDISIRFDQPDECPGSGIWRVDRQPSFSSWQDIPTNGDAFDPDSLFKIQKYNNSGGTYKFVQKYNGIGVITDTQTQIEHLLLSRPPLEVTFMPLRDYLTSTFLKTMVPLMY